MPLHLPIARPRRTPPALRIADAWPCRALALVASLLMALTACSGCRPLRQQGAVEATAATTATTAAREGAPTRHDSAGVADRGRGGDAPVAAAAVGGGDASTPGVDLIVVGDTGIDEAAQHNIAKAMADHCRAERCDGLLHLGDIVYPDGITSPADPRLVSHFERPYRDLGVPIWLSLGNHDYRSSADAWIAAYQPDEKAKRPGAIDARIPARYYTFALGGVRILALDSNRFDVAQGRWIDAVLAESRKQGELWVVAFAHHPRRSHGMHRDMHAAEAAFFDRHLCNRIDLYVAGHDHDKQVLDPHCGIHLLVAGSGAMLRPVGRGANTRFAASTLGFGRLSFRGGALTVSLHAADGGREYQRSLLRQRAPLATVADGVCRGVAADPDCTGRACAADGACDAVCAADPDCAPSAENACPCDQVAGVCERVDAGRLCGCDAACAAGLSACGRDEHCDKACGDDPDCR